MATVNDIVTRALRRAKVVAHHEAPEADDARSVLAMFNEMLFGWKAKGVDVSHTEQTLSDNFQLSDEYREGVVFLLAIRIATEYGLPIPTADGMDANYWWRTFQAKFGTVETATIDSGLLNLPSQNGFRIRSQ